MKATAIRSSTAADVTAQRTDVRRVTRCLAAVVMPLGPAAVAILRFRLPYFTSADNPTALVQSVASDQPGQSLVLWCGFIAVLTLVPGVLWVGRLTRRGAPRLTTAALLLLAPGYVSLAWFMSSDVLLWAGVHEGVDVDTVARMYVALHPTSVIAAGIFVIGHVLGTILLGIALWRTHTVPRWAALATITSQPLHFATAVILGLPWLDLVAWGMNAVGFAVVSVAVLRLTDDEWDLPPLRPLS